ncbi:MAG: DUF4381 family protein, partial [Bacteroidaceae bacterium]|nr:DUF4381 family protein [Bacteroidaceae bacterium]
EVLVTSFDSGLYYIPPFKYVFDEDTFATESLSLKIVPVDVPDEATAADVKDIKDVVAPPFVLWDFVPVWLLVLIGVIALLAVAAFFAIKYFKNRKVEEEIPVAKRIPPYELAMQELQQLRESKLWQQGQEKQYYTRLVDILREYIDNRFGINAMEMTSSQILAALQRNKDTKEVNKYLNEILSMADFVKFAKMRPLQMITSALCVKHLILLNSPVRNPSLLPPMTLWQKVIINNISLSGINLATPKKVSFK